MLLQPGHALDAIHAGQVDVHQHDVRIFLGNVPQPLLTRGVRADTSQTRRVAQALGKTFAHIALIFDDGKGDHYVWFR